MRFDRHVGTLAVSLSLLLTGALLYGGNYRVAGALLCVASVLPMLRLGLAALRFLERRGILFLKNLQKRGKYGKKI
jgi:hypothetical protein